MKTYAERLRHALEVSGMTQQQLADRIGVKQQSIQYLCKLDGKDRKSAYTPQIAEILNVRAQWLATGQGKKERSDRTLNAEMAHFRLSLAEQLKKIGVNFDELSDGDRALLEEPYEIPVTEELIRESEKEYRASVGDTSYFSESHPIREHFAKIKKFDVELSAGHGASVGEESANSFLYFRKDWLERKELDEKNLCIVYVKGHSMEPTINDQEVILVDSSEYYTHRENVDDGFIYAISVDGEAMVKRLFKKPGGGLIVRSDSPAPQYRDMVLEGADLDYLRIIGRAIWHAGDL